MFAGLGGSYNIFPVHRWRKHHIHYVNIGVIGYLIKGLVIVDVLVRDVIFCLP